jgi:hypothetical protein
MLFQATGKWKIAGLFFVRGNPGEVVAVSDYESPAREDARPTSFIDQSRPAGKLTFSV